MWELNLPKEELSLVQMVCIWQITLLLAALQGSYLYTDGLFFIRFFIIIDSNSFFFNNRYAHYISPPYFLSSNIFSVAIEKFIPLFVHIWYLLCLYPCSEIAMWGLSRGFFSIVLEESDYSQAMRIGNRKDSQKYFCYEFHKFLSTGESSYFVVEIYAVIIAP